MRVIPVSRAVSGIAGPAGCKQGCNCACTRSNRQWVNCRRPLRPAVGVNDAMAAAEQIAGIAGSVELPSERPLGYVQASLAFAAAAALAGPSMTEALYEELKPKRCKHCLGTGYTICTACQGRGRVGLSLPGEPSAVTMCRACKRGHCKCSKCNATGITNYWLWQPASDPGWGPRGS